MALKEIHGRNQYRILKSLGKGGYGETFLVKQIPGNRKLVFKRLSTGLISDEIRTRFRMEFMGVRKLANIPGVVAVEEMIEENNLLGYIMEYVPHSLLEWVDSHPSKRHQVFYSILKTMALVHGQNIAHRDIKPENIRISDAGEPTIIDFGIAYWGTESVTQYFYREEKVLFMGTLLFIPPEILYLNDRYRKIEEIVEANADLTQINQRYQNDIVAIARVLKTMHDVFSLGMVGLILYNQEFAELYLKQPANLLKNYVERPFEFIRYWLDKTESKIREKLAPALQGLPSRRITDAREFFESFTGETLQVTSPEQREVAENGIYCLHCGRLTLESSVVNNSVLFCGYCGAKRHHRFFVYSPFTVSSRQLSIRFNETAGAYVFMLPVDQEIQITVGRNPDNMLMIPDFTVSRNHFVLKLQKDGIHLQNLKPYNPIHVEDVMIDKPDTFKMTGKFSLSFGGANYLAYDQVFYKKKKGER